jgi:hypothetical protein
VVYQVVYTNNLLKRFRFWLRDFHCDCLKVFVRQIVSYYVVYVVPFMNVGNVSESRISAGNEFHNLAPS